jgi:hypothetical protein
MWPVRRARIPESCRDLDRDHVVATIEACEVNISAAARKLGVPSHDLRRLLVADPEILALAAEQEERRLDKAEAILERELNSDDPRFSAAAAYFVLKQSRRAVSRGWRQPDAEVTVVNNGPPVSVNFSWGDGTKVATMSVPAGTHIPRSLIEHDSDAPPPAAE